MRRDQTPGVDGLTAEELQASRQAWWDDPFTQFLLRWIPPATRRLLDVGCGLATAAHALLPFLRDATYLGIDADEERLLQARALLAGAPWAARVRVAAARAERLPCGDDSVDLVLSSMMLQHTADVGRILAEVKRALRAGGRFVAVEPENLSNRFYFDGPLEEVNAGVERLFADQRAARRPADLAIGPAVPSLVEQVGLAVVDCRPYALGRLSRLSAAELLDRARRVATVATRQTDVSANPIVRESLAAIDRAAAAVAPGRVGYGGQVAVVFVTIAERR
jgi:SAM-dependent methyltransferase